MTAAHRRYLLTEMTVAAIVSAVLSLAFAVLVFGGQASVAVTGIGGLAFDALPQSFMVALMSSLVPTLLTRRRMVAGTVPPRSTRLRLPAGAGWRAVAIAVAATLAAGITHALLLPLTGPAWSFGAVVTYKIVYGAALGAGGARLAVVAALGDRVTTD